GTVVASGVINRSSIISTEETYSASSSSAFTASAGVTYSVWMMASSSYSPSPSVKFSADATLTPSPLAISGTPVAAATEGTPYAGFTASAAGGDGSYSYALVGGWPAGLAVD